MTGKKRDNRQECLRCPDGEVHSTGSTLYIICKHQKGVRQINDRCNLSLEKQWLLRENQK